MEFEDVHGCGVRLREASGRKNGSSKVGLTCACGSLATSVLYAARLGCVWQAECDVCPASGGADLGTTWAARAARAARALITRGLEAVAASAESGEARRSNIFTLAVGDVPEDVESVSNTLLDDCHILNRMAAISVINNNFVSGRVSLFGSFRSQQLSR